VAAIAPTMMPPINPFKVLSFIEVCSNASSVMPCLGHHARNVHG
jgi:hypothetical protein